MNISGCCSAAAVLLRRLADSRSAQILLVFLSALVAFWPALQASFVNYDDVQYVLANQALRGTWLQAFLHSPGYYHPLVTLSYKLEFVFFGLNPLPYHITGWLMNAACAASLLVLLLETGVGRAAAFFAAVFFAVHPVHAEAAVWVSGRKELMCCFFILWSMFFYLKYSSGGGRLAYFTSLLLFVLAGLSKPFALAAVAALPAADWLKPDSRSAAVRSADKIPFIISAAALFFLSYSPSGFLLGGDTGVFSPLDMLATWWKILFYYLFSAIWPFNLSAMYTPAVLPSAAAALSAAVPAAAVFILLLIRAARGVIAARTFFFWLVFSLAVLSPALLLRVPADRYLYTALAGPAAAYGLLASALLSRQGVARAAAALGILLHAVLLSGLSIERSRVWRNSLTLASDITAGQPEQPAGWRLLGDAFYAEGRLGESVAAYRRGLSLNPADWQALSNMSRALADSGDFASAAAGYDEALKLNPLNAMLFLNRGNLRFRTGDYPGAAADYNYALELNPGMRPAEENLAAALAAGAGGDDGL